MKLANEYSGLFENFDATPKAVYAAIAFSLAMRLSEDDASAALDLCEKEWWTLYNNGIIRQKPRNRPLTADEAAAGRGVNQ